MSSFKATHTDLKKTWDFPRTLTCHCSLVQLVGSNGEVIILDEMNSGRSWVVFLFRLLLDHNKFGLLVLQYPKRKLNFKFGAFPHSRRKWILASPSWVLSLTLTWAPHLNQTSCCHAGWWMYVKTVIRFLEGTLPKAGWEAQLLGSKEERKGISYSPWHSLHFPPCNSLIN